METTNAYEARFGAHVADYKVKTGKMIVKYFLWLILPLLLLAAGVVALISPELLDIGPDEAFVTYLLLGVGAIGALAVCALLKHYTAQLFEHGVVLKKGSKVIELDFSEIEGISYSVTNTSVNFIPVATTRVLEILPYQGKAISIIGLKMQKMSVFAEHLEGLHAEFMINTLTKENIKTKTIRFGKKFVLENGVFVSGKKRYPLEDIFGVNNYNGIVTLEGKNAKGKKANLLNIQASQAYNVTVLYHIIYKLRDKGMTTYQV